MEYIGSRLVIPAATTDTDEGAEKRADHNGQQHRLPADERPDHCHEFNVPSAHALFSKHIGTDPGQEP